MKNVLRGLFLAICLFQVHKSFTQQIYDLKYNKDIKLYFREKNWGKKLDSLKRLGNSYRLCGSMMFDGVQYDSVLVRYKGNSSYNAVRQQHSAKLPFNIRVNEFYKKQRLPGGYETFKLSNVFRDPSFIREALAYDIYRKYMPASQANFARLYINEKLIGLYNSIEPVEDAFLRHHFGSDQGILVKCDPDWQNDSRTNCPANDKASLTYLGEDPRCYLTYYEMKSDDKISELVKFIRILNKEPEKLETILNIDQTLWMHALNNCMVNLDSYLGKLSHNYYLYKDTSGIWQPIIWDLNLCFGGFRLDGIEANPLSNEKLQQLSPLAHTQDAQFPLIAQLFKNDLYRKIYFAHMKTVLRENFINVSAYTKAAEIKMLIDPWVKEDKNKLYSYEAFKQNTDFSADAGKSKTIGITELMKARTSYLQSHPLLQHEGPDLNSNTAVKKSGRAYITCKMTNGHRVICYYRPKAHMPFKSVEMKDNGNQDDASANDGVFSISLPENQVNQYYFLGVNADAVSFFPERASHDFFDIK